MSGGGHSAGAGSTMATGTILVIDDERRMANSLRDLLADIGYEVDVAYGGQPGIAKLRTRAYQVVITDLRMENVDGLAVIRHVHENYPKTLIVVITGYASTESAIEAVHYQVFDYLRKPFDFELIRLVLEKAFQKLETDQLREDTAAMLSHDIKIPLSSIIGFAQMIHNPVSGQLHPRTSEFAETIEANGQKILNLLDNYLTSCKIEDGTFQISAVPSDMSGMIRDLISASQFSAKRCGCPIEANLENLPEMVRVDEPLLYRAVGNLLQNAIKYNSGDRPIHIGADRVTAAESALGVDTLEIWVEKRGPRLLSQ